MPVRSTQEGEHLVVQHVADGRPEAGTDEGELSLVAEGVLHGHSKLTQFGDLVAVDLVERDQQPGTVFLEQGCQALDLRA